MILIRENVLGSMFMRVSRFPSFVSDRVLDILKQKMTCVNNAATLSQGL